MKHLLDSLPISVKAVVGLIIMYALSTCFLYAINVYNSNGANYESIMELVGSVIHMIIWLFLLHAFLNREWWSRFIIMIFGVFIITYGVVAMLSLPLAFLLKSPKLYIPYLLLIAALLSLILPTTGQWINNK